MAYRYISRNGACAVCGKSVDCRVNDRGGVHCRRLDDRFAPPAGWIYVGDDAENFGIYWPDDGRTPDDRRGERAAAHIDAARRAAAAARAAGLTAPVPDGRLSFAEIESRRLSLTELQAACFTNDLLAGVVAGPAALEALGARFLRDPLPQEPWAFVFPERDGDDVTTGYNLRFRDGRKLTYGPRGLFVPATWAATPGPVYIPEGVSDTLALTALGLAAIGRASNTSGAELLAVLLRRYGFAGGESSADVPIVVLGENDQKPNGDWPGRYGAERVARQLAEVLERPVMIAYPPAGHKDIRNILEARRADLASGQVTPADLGAELAAWFAASWQPIGGPTPATAATSAATPADPLQLIAARLAGSVDRDYRPATIAPPDVCPTPARIVLRHAANNRLLVVLIGCARLTCPYCAHGKRALYLETVSRRLAEAEINGLETLYVATVSPADWPRVGVHFSRQGADYFRVSLPGDRYLVVATAPTPAGVPSSAATLTEGRTRLRIALHSIPLTAGGVFASSKRWKLLTKDERGEPLGWTRQGIALEGWLNVTGAHGVRVRPAGGSKDKFPERHNWEIDLTTLPPGVTWVHLVSDLNSGYATTPNVGGDNDNQTTGGAIDWATWKRGDQ